MIRIVELKTTPNPVGRTMDAIVRRSVAERGSDDVGDLWTDISLSTRFGLLDHSSDRRD